MDESLDAVAAVSTVVLSGPNRETRQRTSTFRETKEGSARPGAP